ncbi:hypothetical protein A6R68_19525, partial [Neotoma lepida]
MKADEWSNWEACALHALSMVSASMRLMQEGLFAAWLAGKQTQLRGSVDSPSFLSITLELAVPTALLIVPAFACLYQEHGSMYPHPQ